MSDPLCLRISIQKQADDVILGGHDRDQPLKEGMGC